MSKKEQMDDLDYYINNTQGREDELLEMFRNNLCSIELLIKDFHKHDDFEICSVLIQNIKSHADCMESYLRLYFDYKSLIKKLKNN